MEEGSVDSEGTADPTCGGDSKGMSGASSSFKLQTSSGVSASSASGAGLLQSFSRKKSRRREVNFTSVLNFQRAIRTNQHRDLTELFQNHKFVGCVDQTRALIQHQTKLYLVDLSRITKELFSQLVIFDFANFGVLKLSPAAPVFDLAKLALELPESGNKSNIPTRLQGLTAL
jgi:DNA mismatch repair ATPase MutL